MLLSDGEIIEACQHGRDSLIYPFQKDQVRELAIDASFGQRVPRVISYGVSSYGYDFRLSDQNFKIFSTLNSYEIVDPKNFHEELLVDGVIRSDHTGTWFLLPGNSYALGETIEKVQMPRDLGAVGIGKSTYARCGLIVNVTPLEPGWRGVITLELANASPAPVKLYAGEGICQFMFMRGSRQCKTSYADRHGKYQDQTKMTVAKV